MRGELIQRSISRTIEPRIWFGHRVGSGTRNLRPAATRNSDPSYRKSIWPDGKLANSGRMGVGHGEPNT